MQKELEDTLTPIRERFLARLEEQVSEFDWLMAKVDDGTEPRDVFREIAAGAHKVAGLAKPIGFPDLGEAASKVDELVFAYVQNMNENSDPVPICEAIEVFIARCDEAISSRSN